jgi:4,5-DOPA dioxygenase extradiol
MLPALFVSHGSPNLIGEDTPAREFLAGLGASLGRPSAIVVASAHWETAVPELTAAAQPETIHDFYGFPEPLYRLRYPAPGNPGLAAWAAALLEGAGIQAATEARRGLDHGAWSPLLLMYPKADIPVVELSVQHGQSPAHHIAVGRALAPLRHDNVLVMGSGGAVHNLRMLVRGRPGDPVAWARDFDEWLDTQLGEGDDAALAAYRREAPGAVQAHPRDEHLLPVFVAYGAGGPGARGRRIHDSFTYGSLSMAAFLFQ